MELTPRLSKAIMRSAWAHEKAGQRLKGTDVPFFVHPMNSLVIVSQFTDDDNILIGILLHDVVEDVDPGDYNIDQIRSDFGATVARIVLDVTKDKSIIDWREQSSRHFQKLASTAIDESLMVVVAEKTDGVYRATEEYDDMGDAIWREKFGGKTPTDKLWAYDSVLKIGRDRGVNSGLTELLGDSIAVLRRKLKEGGSLEDDVAV